MSSEKHIYEINENLTRQRRSASAVVAVILTGAFVLETLGLPPLMFEVYDFIFEDTMPQYFVLGMEAAGAFSLLVSVMYVIFVSPISCLGFYDGPSDIDFTPSKLDGSDFISLIMVYGMFLWLIYSTGVDEANMYIGGLVVIIFTTIAFKVIPRQISNYITPSCFYGIKIIIVSLPISVIALVPALMYTHYMT